MLVLQEITSETPTQILREASLLAGVQVGNLPNQERAHAEPASCDSSCSSSSEILARL